jgi:regulatory protein
MWTRRFPSRAEPGSSSDAALEHALRALAHRDRSTVDMNRLLERRGVDEETRQDVLDTLVRTALLDDARFAAARASALAGRGAGNELIRHELTRAGIEPDRAAEAIDALESEEERADRVVARRGGTSKTARYLARKGFSEDVVHAAVARTLDEPLG